MNGNNTPDSTLSMPIIKALLLLMIIRWMLRPVNLASVVSADTATAT